MTTPTVPAPSPVDHAALGLTSSRIVRAELIKLTSLRSTRHGVAALVVVVVGLGTVAAATTHATSLATQDAVDLALAGAALGVLLTAAIGAVAGARELASGLIRTTVAAVPRRATLVVAKAVALAAVLVPASVAAVLGAFAVASAVLRGRGVAMPALTDPDVARAVLGTAVYLVGIALVGLAVGILVRSTAGAVATVLGAVLIVPTLAGVLLPHRWSHALELLPSAAGNALTSTERQADLLSPLAGGADFAGWIVLALALAALALSRRDA